MTPALRVKKRRAGGRPVTGRPPARRAPVPGAGRRGSVGLTPEELTQRDAEAGEAKHDELLARDQRGDEQLEEAGLGGDLARDERGDAVGGHLVVTGFEVRVTLPRVEVNEAEDGLHVT